MELSVVSVIDLNLVADDVRTTIHAVGELADQNLEHGPIRLIDVDCGCVAGLVWHCRDHEGRGVRSARALVVEDLYLESVLLSGIASSEDNVVLVEEWLANEVSWVNWDVDL